MAYKFTSASSQYLSATGSNITMPLTIGAWLYRTGSGVRVVASINNISSPSVFSMYFDNTNLYAFSLGTGGNSQASRALAPINQWSHACAVYASNNSKTAFVDGVAGAENTNIITPANTNVPAIGSRYLAQFGGWGVFSNDIIAEVGIWNAALTQPEIASLAKGMTCDKIRPQNLIFYAPLVRDLQDTKGGLTITNNNGATVSNHPRIYA